jgi:hypothetical protein
MSHYFAAVVVPADTTIENAEAAVRPILEPYDENLEVEEYTNEDGETYWRNPRGKWDWFQVGGRWTGVWSSYDPSTDPANIETCSLCAGSGLRNDSLGMAHRRRDPEYTCNGCGGKGTRVKWPTQWEPTSGDVVPVAAVLDNPDARTPFAVVIPEGGWHERETWNGESFDVIPEDVWGKRVRELLEPYRNAKLVVVDFHN